MTAQISSFSTRDIARCKLAYSLATRIARRFNYFFLARSFREHGQLDAHADIDNSIRMYDTTFTVRARVTANHIDLELWRGSPVGIFKARLERVEAGIWLLTIPAHAHNPTGFWFDRERTELVATHAHSEMFRARPPVRMGDRIAVLAVRIPANGPLTTRPAKDYLRKAKKAAEQAQQVTRVAKVLANNVESING